jgi:hypothetical protein
MKERGPAAIAKTGKNVIFSLERGGTMKSRKGERRINAVVLGLTLIGLLAAQATAAGEPRIKFRETAWDFGKVSQGKTVSHAFVFTNEGDAALVIKRVTTTCGCTAALVSAERVAPGQEGKIEVRFDTRGYGGQVGKLVYVESNDPNEPKKQLEVRADIEVPPSPKIEIDPYNLDIGLLVEGEELQAGLKLMNRGEMELRAEFNHRSAQYFVAGKPASVPLKVAAGKEVEVEVRIPTMNRVGVIREYVLVKSNDPMRSTLSLYLSGYIISKEQLKELFNKYKDILR